jgi:hypothetical protein
MRDVKNGENVFINDARKTVTRVRPDGSAVIEGMIDMPNGESWPFRREFPPGSLPYSEDRGVEEQNVRVFDPARYGA